MNWRKIYWDAPDLPPKDTEVLVSVEGQMYVAILRVTPAYATGRKKIVQHPEERIFHVTMYDYCCRDENEISLNAKDFYWIELPKGPNDDLPPY